MLPKLVSKTKSLPNFEDHLPCPAETFRSHELHEYISPFTLQFTVKIFMNVWWRSASKGHNLTSVLDTLLTSFPNYQVYREWRETVFLPRDISISALPKLLKDLQSLYFTASPSVLDIRQQSARGTAPAVIAGVINTKFWNSAHSKGSPCARVLQILIPHSFT